MLHYFNPVSENGYTYSVDGVRINFTISHREVDDFLQYLQNAIHTESKPQSSALFRYRNLVTLRYDTESSMSVGFSLNDNKPESKYRGFLDFNPNKVARHDLFWNDYRYLKSCCPDFAVSRIDIACDIPVKREYLILEKDKRKYAKHMNSLQDCTEYLGLRSNVGFVKLYNKSIESELDILLSRLEVTCKDNSTSYFSLFPAVYDISFEKQLGLEIESLNDTEKAILKSEYLLLINGLDDGLSIFKSYGRKIREKLKPFLFPKESVIDPSRIAVEKVLALFHEAFNLH